MSESTEHSLLVVVLKCGEELEFFMPHEYAVELFSTYMDTASGRNANESIVFDSVDKLGACYRSTCIPIDRINYVSFYSVGNSSPKKAGVL